MDQFESDQQVGATAEGSIPAASTVNDAVPGEKVGGRETTGAVDGAVGRARPRYHLERYRRVRAAAIEALGGRCVQCGATDLLEFDHVDRATKSFTLTELWGVAKERFDAELAKCQLLCRGCHRRKTTSELRTKTHGTWAMYQRHRCRCGVCRRFVSAYKKSRAPARRQRARGGP